MKRNCCIVVPVYKRPEEYNANEKSALVQILRTFPGRDVYCITYPELFEEYSRLGLKVLVYDKEYFSYSGYNKLCKSEMFYLDFLGLGFTYMCLIQLDVWVFQDNLDYFLDIFDREGYDYIGAPWYGVHFCEDGAVGNGGACIRRLDTFRNICREFPIGGGNEDVYFLRVHGDKINVAPEKLALEFSWEEKPYFAYKLSNFRLPMMTHAYASTPDRISFWRQYIPNIQEIKCRAGEMDVYNNPSHTIKGE